MTLRIACFAVMALALAACGTPTPYIPVEQGDEYGYSVQQIEGDRFRVSFSGNSLTDRRTVENYLLYRAAELTLAQGKDYFVVVRRDIDADTTYHTTYDDWPHFGPYPYWHPYWNRGFGWSAWDTGISRPITRYEAFAEIVLRSGAKPVDNPRAFDASEVVRNLGPTIVRLAPPVS